MQNGKLWGCIIHQLIAGIITTLPIKTHLGGCTVEALFFLVVVKMSVRLDGMSLTGLMTGLSCLGISILKLSHGGCRNTLKILETSSKKQAHHIGTVLKTPQRMKPDLQLCRVADAA